MGQRVPTCSVTGTKEQTLRDVGAGTPRRRPQPVGPPQGPGSFSAAQAGCSARGCGLQGCALWGCGLWSRQGGFKTQLTFRPRLAFHGQGVEAQLISPAALFPATLSGRVRRCQRSELPPRGTGPRCKGRTTVSTARRLLSVLGEFKRPQALLLVSVDFRNWLQHEGAADFECAAGGRPWQRGLCGVGVWRGGGAQKGDREDSASGQCLEEMDRQTHGKTAGKE